MTLCVLVQPIAAAGVAALEAAGITLVQAPRPDLDALLPLLGEAVAVITRDAGLPAAAIAAAPRLRVIASHGSGTDRIDTAAAAARGIAVVATPGTNARSVAEHALALMLALARAIPAADRALRAGDFGWRDRHPGVELAGLRLGLLGWGHVARALAPMAQALGMEVRAHSRHAGARELARAGVRPEGDLDALLAGSDILSLHARPAGGPLIDAARLARMQPGAFLVNTARGALVDEAALAAALAAGRLGGAALDVFAPEPPAAASPLLSAPNLILTPHIGGTTAAALERTALAVAAAVIAALAPR